MGRASGRSHRAADPGGDDESDGTARIPRPGDSQTRHP